jgi:hypothetical protein
MSVPREKFNRLLGALDDLVSREAAMLAAGDYLAVNAIQRRAEPLVAGLAALGESAADAVARAKVAALLARRQHSMDFLESQLETARAELLAVEESTQRVSRIAPVYGRTGNVPSSPQFRAAG